MPEWVNFVHFVTVAAAVSWYWTTTPEKLTNRRNMSLFFTAVIAPPNVYRLFASELGSRDWWWGALMVSIVVVGFVTAYWKQR